MFKKIIQKQLERYVTQYFKRHPEVKLVAVAGSVGKTSTKRAIATVLSQKYRVGMHEGNYNTHLSAPLTILGIEYPGEIRSVGAWLSVFRAARQRVREPADVDVIVAEFGSDRPGEVAHFGTYVTPYIGVVTAVTPEHMEFFHSIEKVAEEEIALANYSEIALINRDDIEGRFASLVTNPAIDTYGTDSAAEYYFEEQDFTVEAGYIGTAIVPEFEAPLPAEIKVVGEHSLRPVMAAVAVAAKMGLTGQEIQKGLALIRSVPGRMNLLRGINSTIIIDDTYNSSPAAASAALQALYGLQAPSRIAILGSMNELGTVSAAEHEKIGLLCDPSLLSWVITIGEEAEKYLAPAARQRGCQVKSFKSAVDAGGFARSVSEPGAIILVKGSQGGVYAEEAVKVLCIASQEDSLVRQSAEWMKIKDAFFSKFK